MSIEEIIKELERLAEGAEQTASVHWKADQGIKERHEYTASALREAITLLRAHPDAQSNKPLTEEEIKKMVGEPVYYPQGPEGKRWLIVDYIAITAVIGGAKLYRRPPSQD